MLQVKWLNNLSYMTIRTRQESYEEGETTIVTYLIAKIKSDFSIPLQRSALLFWRLAKQPEYRLSETPAQYSCPG
ncbi:hypothetical protein M514_02113 [Trichuris suis]|uniref:Uncharacterized protein n=1 Tax=Trichuris suis TaxID=68888 RepID=A0A085MWX5_9BILA|nr:hypothetical protein M513_02113 [Trichuris suis]KFD61721.1 hypothetical protein M514_02113 [Trichuris suis]